jgi:hypothetical protein
MSSKHLYESWNKKSTIKKTILKSLKDSLNLKDNLKDMSNPPRIKSFVIIHGRYATTWTPSQNKKLNGQYCFSLSKLQTTMCNLWTTVQTYYRQKSILENKGILKNKTMYKNCNIKMTWKMKNKNKMKWNDSKCTLHTKRGLVWLLRTSSLSLSI